MNDDNQFEIEKLTEKEIKETHLFKSSQSKNNEEGNIMMDIEDSLIGSIQNKTKKSDYGQNLKAKISKYHSEPKINSVEIDFK